MKFVINLRHIGGVVPMEEVQKKRLKHFINDQLVLRARSQKERKSIFGKI